RVDLAAKGKRSGHDGSPLEEYVGNDVRWLPDGNAMMESAGWHPDPSLRHEYRYWDGSVWTDTVADSGLLTVDPLIAEPASNPVVAAASPFASPAGAAWQPPAATAEPARSHEPTWVVVLALLLFFPIGLALVW